MTRLLLDSDIVIRVIRSHPDSVARLRNLPPSGWVISAMTAYEIQKGIAKKPEASPSKIALEFLAASSIEPISYRVAARAAAIHQNLSGLGIKIGVADEIIAAHALEAGATLVTNNLKHFEQVPGLRIESWP